MAIALQSNYRRYRGHLDDRNNSGGIDLRVLGRNKTFLQRLGRIMRYFIIPAYIIQFTFFATTGILVAKQIESWHQQTNTLTMMTYTLQQLTEISI